MNSSQMKDYIEEDLTTDKVLQLTRKARTKDKVIHYKKLTKGIPHNIDSLPSIQEKPSMCRQKGSNTHKQIIKH